MTNHAETIASLKNMLARLLETREKEAKAWMDYENAKDNYSGRVSLESRRHQQAMLDSSAAEQDARDLLNRLECIGNETKT